MYLYDSTERVLFNSFAEQVEEHRRSKQQAMTGDAAPGQRVTEDPIEATPYGAQASVVEAAKVARTPRKKKTEVVEAITPEAPAALEGDEAPMRPQTHGGALKSGGSPAPKKAETEVVVTTVAAPVSLDDARTKLQQYAEKNGLPAASKLLAEYGAKRIGDVPTDRLAGFVARLA
jgi:hypothetical protein